MPAFPFTGLSPNDPVPGSYIQVGFAAGPGSGAAAPDKALIIANRTAGGTATSDTVYGPDTAVPAVTLADFATLFGLRSAAYRMAKRFLARNTQTPLYVVAPPASVGAAATLAITFVGTATANGIARLRFAEEFIDTVVTNGDLIGAIATNVAASVNSIPDWPFTASATLGVVTLTAAVPGLRGNWLRAGCDIIGTLVGTTVTPSLSAVAAARFAGGTVTDTWTNSLAAILSTQYTGIISEDDGGQSSTGLPALATQVTTQWLPTNNIRQRFFAGSTDGTNANVTATALALNTYYGELIYQPNGDFPPSEIAASTAAGELFNEINFTASSVNYNGWGADPASAPLWKIPAAKCGTAISRAQETTCINGGITPVMTLTGGATSIGRRITLYSQTAGVADYRVRDMSKVVITMKFAADVQNMIALNTARSTVGDDIDPTKGQKQRPPGVVVPHDILAIIRTNIDKYDALGLVDNAALVFSGTTCTRVGTQIQSYVPFRPADILNSTATFVAQTF